MPTMQMSSSDSRRIDDGMQLDNTELRQFFRFDIFLAQCPLKPGLEKSFRYIWLEEYQAVVLHYVGNGEECCDRDHQCKDSLLIIPRSRNEIQTTIHL